jgi:hypothetical protein
MYIVINKTENSSYTVEGSFPCLEHLLNRGDKLIVVSLYSNTVKVPYQIDDHGSVEWEWRDL